MRNLLPTDSHEFGDWLSKYLTHALLTPSSPCQGKIRRIFWVPLKMSTYHPSLLSLVSGYTSNTLHPLEMQTFTSWTIWGATFHCDYCQESWNYETRVEGKWLGKLEPYFLEKSISQGTLLGVPWLRIRTSNAGGKGLIPGQRIQLSYSPKYSKKKKKGSPQEIN